MRLALALSGETPTARLLADFDHIGLVRSEYLFRDAQLYPDPENARHVLYDYLMAVCSVSAGRPVWFRTLEVNTREANTLRGVEEIIWAEKAPMMGLRGIRRSMKHPASLEAELEVIGEVSSTHPNLGIVAPFVTDADEFAWFRERVEKHLGVDAQVASMVETPAAVLTLESILRVPASHVIVGTNDLSSLLLAKGRTSIAVTDTSLALAKALVLVRDATAKFGVTMAVAGYLTDGLIASAEHVGADYAVVHYSDLTRLYGPRYADLPEADHVRSVKRKTQAAIAALEPRR
jgi:phosphoenolpyruvate-protein kinase (PTS system EI component)